MIEDTRSAPSGFFYCGLGDHLCDEDDFIEETPDECARCVECDEKRKREDKADG